VGGGGGGGGAGGGGGGGGGGVKSTFGIIHRRSSIDSCFDFFVI